MSATRIPSLLCSSRSISHSLVYFRVQESWIRAQATGEGISSGLVPNGGVKTMQGCVQCIDEELEPSVLVACGEDDVE